MNNRASFETLLTVSLPEDLYGSLVSCQQEQGFGSMSMAIRSAIDQFDFAELPDVDTMRQISFRISKETRARLAKLARQKQVSLGHLIRAALRVLPENANLIPNKDTLMPPKTVKKAVAKKAPAKKAVVKKAPAQKAAVKKAPAKKVVAKKAPAKKVVAKKAVAKKAPVKKAAVKKAPVKKVVAKKAPAKKVVAKKAAKK